MNLQRILWPALATGLLSVLATARAEEKPVVARKPAKLVTYRFTAKIIRNGGIAPFKVGTKITGQFTYDLNAKKVRGNNWYAHYDSLNSRIVFKYGSLVFKSKGFTRLAIVQSRRSEHFGVVTYDLEMPKGWRLIPAPKPLRNRGQSFSVYVDNEPPRNVLQSIAIPRKVDLSNFSERQFRFDAYFGLEFPGGKVTKRATLYAELEELVLIKPK